MATAEQLAGLGQLPPGRQNSYDRDALLACARGELFDRDSARLPLPDMLMTDRVSLITNVGGQYDKGEIAAELDIDPELWFFKCRSTRYDDASLVSTLHGRRIRRSGVA